jgi:hypothetical protein
MDQQTQLWPNKFAAPSSSGTTADPPRHIGFDAAQRASLGQRAACPTPIEGRPRASPEDKDLFRIIARRLGMDGEPPVSLEAAAQALNVDPGYAAYAEGEALQKCGSKTALEDFKKELRRLALEALSRSGEKPQKESVLQKLERLAQLHAAADLARMDYEARRAGGAQEGPGRVGRT